MDNIHQTYGYDVNTQVQRQALKAGTNTFYYVNEKQLANLIIEKVDADTRKPLANVGFTVQFASTQVEAAKKYVGQYVTQSGGYSTNPTVLRTNASGLIELKNLWRGTYRVVEVDNPNQGYILPEGGSSSTVDLSQDRRYTIENVKISTNTNGRVWEDVPSKKNNSRDNELGEGDILLSNVYARLVGAISQEVKTLNRKLWI